MEMTLSNGPYCEDLGTLAMAETPAHGQSQGPPAATVIPSAFDAQQPPAQQNGLDAQPLSASRSIQRKEVIELMESLSARHHILLDRFVLLDRAPQRGAQGCVHVAVDKDRDHERVAVKTFFSRTDFITETSLYVNEDVQAQGILPQHFAVGAWDKV